MPVFDAVWIQILLKLFNNPDQPIKLSYSQNSEDFVKVINLCVFWINCLYDEIKWKYRYKINDKPRFYVLRGNYFDVVNNLFVLVFVGGDEV
jgi:hypothetical protein